MKKMSNENTNRLLRQYFPKGTPEYTVHGFTPEELIALREMIDAQGMNVDDLLTLGDPAKLDEAIKDSIERVNADRTQSETKEDPWRQYYEQQQKYFEDLLYNHELGRRLGQHSTEGTHSGGVGYGSSTTAAKTVLRTDPRASEIVDRETIFDRILGEDKS